MKCWRCGEIPEDDVPYMLCWKCEHEVENNCYLCNASDNVKVRTDENNSKMCWECYNK